MKKITLILIIAILPVMIWANFIGMNRGARAYAMGNSFVALADDATAVFWNPAGLAQLNKIEFTLSHQNLYGIEDLYNEMAAISLPLPYIRLGLGWRQIHLMDEYYEQQLALSAASIVWYKKIPIRFGVSINHYLANVDYSGADTPTAFDADIGLLIHPTKAFSVGFSSQNLLQAEMKFLQQADKLERKHTLGFAYNWRNIVIFTADNVWQNNSSQWNIGGEMWFYDVFAPRLGVNGENLTAGFGLKTKKWHFDAAVLSEENLGSTYRLDFGMSFDSFLN